MGAVICFDRAEQRAHQDGIDAADRATSDLNAVQGRITAELVLRFLAGLNDPLHAAPMPFASYGGGHYLRERSMPFAEAVADVLDSMEVFGALFEVLAESECPKVHALKRRMAQQYATENAEMLARRECGE